jgi:uncharacterized protein YidB (DUF937 family)
MASQELTKKLGIQVEPAQLQSAVSSLLGGSKGGIDLAGLASKMGASGDLSGILDSWLGDGANASISADSVSKLLGEAKVSEFANQLGVQPEAAAASLSDVLPQIMDKSSSGGKLLESVGGMEGLMGAARSFLK